MMNTLNTELATRDLIINIFYPKLATYTYKTFDKTHLSPEIRNMTHENQRILPETRNI